MHRPRLSPPLYYYIFHSDTVITTSSSRLALPLDHSLSPQ